MAIAPPPPAWVQWVSMVSVLAALGILVRIAGFVYEIRVKVNTMWESWLFEHAHLAPTPRTRPYAAKQGSPR